MAMSCGMGLITELYCRARRIKVVRTDSIEDSGVSYKFSGEWIINITTNSRAERELDV